MHTPGAQVKILCTRQPEWSQGAGCTLNFEHCLKMLRMTTNIVAQPLPPGNPYLDQN